MEKLDLVKFRTEYRTGKYSGGRLVKISRSVQRLTLLLPVEEQPGKLIVNDGKIVEEI